MKETISRTFCEIGPRLEKEKKINFHADEWPTCKGKTALQVSLSIKFWEDWHKEKWTGNMLDLNRSSFFSWTYSAFNLGLEQSRQWLGKKTFRMRLDQSDISAATLRYWA